MMNWSVYLKIKIFQKKKFKTTQTQNFSHWSRCSMKLVTKLMLNIWKRQHSSIWRNFMKNHKVKKANHCLTCNSAQTQLTLWSKTLMFNQLILFPLHNQKMRFKSFMMVWSIDWLNRLNTMNKVKDSWLMTLFSRL